MVLHIDLETYSSVDLRAAGLYKYVQSPDFQILLFSYSYDYAPAEIVDLTKEPLPEHLVRALADPRILKKAFNAAFEYYCLSKFYKTDLAQWQCTMVQALYCGLPGSLDAVGKALGLAPDKQKMSVGRALIQYFCKPCKPTKRNLGRTRNMPQHDPAKWELFKEYNKRDVEVECTIDEMLQDYPVPESEWELWRLDQRINIWGTRLDMRLVEGALAINDQAQDELTEQAQNITGLANPNSVAQLKEWLMANADLEIESLNKATVSDLLNGPLSDDVGQLLRIRQELGKTSVKKYAAMQSCVCEDERVRGLLQFYGASRTGRWAGRLVQVQNLSKNYIGTLDVARDLVRRRNIQGIRLIYGSVQDILSQLVRTAFIPGEGCHFTVADFSAIEARVIAWLAKEQWRLDVFATHGKIYEASASTMFGVPLDSIAKGRENYNLRAKGKVAELALGYGGGAGALIAMGALKMGLTEEELPDIVTRWRASSRRIYDFWYALQRAAEEAIAHGVITTMNRGLQVFRDSKYLIIQLPSGRRLHYPNPELRSNGRGGHEIWYDGQAQNTKQWTRISTWGGKLTENVVQAIARDVLAYALMNLDRAGYRVNFHIHDEVILEVPDADPTKSLEDAVRLMCVAPPWAQDLPLNADGFEDAEYYKKE